MMFIVLPYPPSENQYRRIVNGRSVISSEGRKFKDAVKTIIRVHRIPRFDGPVSVDVILSPPDRRCRDLDNPLKATLDAISDEPVKAGNKILCTLPGILANDSQVKHLSTRWAVPSKSGKMILHIEPFNDLCEEFLHIIQTIENCGYMIYGNKN